MAFTGTWSGDPEYGTEDDHYDIPGSSDAVIAEIPAYLDERFAISENIAMYEDEE